MALDEKELSVLAQQNEQIAKSINELGQTMGKVVEYFAKTEAERSQMTAKQAAEEAEMKTFRKFVKMLKAEGLLSKEAKFPKAEGQKDETPEKKPEAQQAVIEGAEAGLGGGGEAPWKKPAVPEEDKDIPDPRREEGADINAACADGDTKKPIQKKDDKDEDEDDELKKLKKENATLKAQIEKSTTSLEAKINEAVEKKMQKNGWSSAGRAPIKVVDPSTQVVLKSAKPTMKREELIAQLSKLSDSARNQLKEDVDAGRVVLPEVE